MAIQKEQLNKVIPASFSAEEILSCLEEDGIIDADSAIDIMTNKRRKEILSRHNHPITQGKDGRWRTRIDDASYADGRRMIARSTKEAVEDVLIELYSYDGITMETLFPEWIKYKSLHVSHSTIERTIRTWNQHYADSEFVKIPLIKLTKLAVDEWVHKMLKEHPMNKHQYGNFRLIIRQELDYAVDRGIIKQNPFNLINVDLRRALKPEHKKPDHTQVYSRDELDRLCEVAWKDYENRNHPVHQLTPLAVMFMFLTGVRVGEVCGIRYEDIHERTMTIRRMVLHPSGEIIEHTKGFEDREVPLVPKALKLIELARERQSEEFNEAVGKLEDLRKEYNKKYEEKQKELEKELEDYYEEISKEYLEKRAEIKKVIDEFNKDYPNGVFITYKNGKANTPLEKVLNDFLNDSFFFNVFSPFGNLLISDSKKKH